VDRAQGFHGVADLLIEAKVVMPLLAVLPLRVALTLTPLKFERMEVFTAEKLFAAHDSRLCPACGLTTHSVGDERTHWLTTKVIA
jgi:hypothetical protein